MSHREVFLYSPGHQYAIAPERNVYLDTSVIRRKLSRLGNSPVTPFAYTSALAYIELLAGIRLGSGRQFYARRSAVIALAAAEVQVDWRMPEAVILSSFPLTRATADIYETRCASLQALVTTLEDSTNHEQFIERADRLNIAETLQYFESYKREFGETYAAIGANERRRSVDVFEPIPFTAQVLGLQPDYDHDEFVRTLQTSPYNYIMSLFVCAERAMEHKGIPFSKAVRKEVALSKDGSIDAYLRALGFWHMEHALGRTPGKNDALDLAHLLYLVPNAHFATADDALAKCADSVGVSVIGPPAWAGA